MPYILQLITQDGEVIESPNIIQDNPRSQYGLEDRKIERSINKTGKRIIKYCPEIIKWRCKHFKVHI